MNKHREKYSSIDQRRMWKFLYKKYKKGDSAKVLDTCGFKIWQDYVQEYPASNRHTVQSLVSHMRRVMKKNFEEADLPKKEFFFLFKRLKWPVSREQKRHLQNRFNVHIELDDEEKIKKVTYLDEEQNGDSRRTPRVDSDTEDQENDEIEIDEHSSVSTNENSDDVQIEEETVNIGNGEKRRQNGQKPMEAETSRSTRRNHATLPGPSSTLNSARPTDSALVRMGMEPSLCEANTSAWPSKSSTIEMVNRIAELAVQGREREETEANVALGNGASIEMEIEQPSQYIPSGRTLRFEKRKSNDRSTGWLGKPKEPRTKTPIPTQNGEPQPESLSNFERDFTPSPPRRVFTPTQRSPSRHQRTSTPTQRPPSRRQRTPTPTQLRERTSAPEEAPTSTTEVANSQATKRVPTTKTIISRHPFDQTLPANFLDIPPLSSSTPVQQKKKPATEIQIKLSLSQVERENEVREHEQQNQNRIIENTDQTISQQADVAQNHELQNPIFAAPAPPPERLNISVDQETQTASEEPPQPAMTNHAFNNRFFRPPQPQNGEPPNQISMPNQIFYRNMLRENLRKLLWGNLPSLYEGIPEQYQEHLKTTKEFGWILKHAREAEPRNQ